MNELILNWALVTQADNTLAGEKPTWSQLVVFQVFSITHLRLFWFFVNRKFTVLCDAFPSCLAICEDVKELSKKNHSTIAFYFGLKFRVVRGRVTATVDVFVERFRLKGLSLTSRIDHYASSPYNF